MGAPLQNISRRSFVTTLGAFALAAALGGCADTRLPDSPPGLGARARRKGKLYGAATHGSLLDDADFAAALRREAGVLVPESELKWSALRPAPDRFDFAGYHRLAAFARANGMGMRGHVLVWHYANPDWLADALTDRRRAEKILDTHIRRVVSETAPLIGEWDVVNEALDPWSPRADGLRETPWLKALGPGYIGEAFRLARAAGPQLKLVYNDFGLEGDDGASRAKRKNLSRLLERERARGTPIHALGLQSHLQCSRPLGGADFAAFLKDVRAMGLEVIVTELDLDLGGLTSPLPERIAAAQLYVRAYLDLITQSGPLDELLTWGLSDRYTWLGEDNPGTEGALPLKADMSRGPLWDTLREGWLGEG